MELRDRRILHRRRRFYQVTMLILRRDIPHVLVDVFVDGILDEIIDRFYVCMLWVVIAACAGIAIGPLRPGTPPVHRSKFCQGSPGGGNSTCEHW